MDNQKSSDFDLVQEAMHAAYPDAWRQTNGSSERWKDSKSTLEANGSNPSSRAQHSCFKTPQAVLLNGTLPIPATTFGPPTFNSKSTFQSAHSTPLPEKPRARDLTESNPALFEGLTGPTVQYVTTGAHKSISVETVPTHEHYMSGALIDTSPTAAEDTGQNDLVCAKRTPSLWETFGFHTLKNVQQGLQLQHRAKPRRSSQSRRDYSWKNVEGKLKLSLDRISDHVEVGKRRRSITSHTEAARDEAGSTRHESTLQSVDASTKQRHRSVDTQGSAAMDISPEDHFAPQIVYCYRNSQNVEEKEEERVTIARDSDNLLLQEKHYAHALDGMHEHISQRSASQDAQQAANTGYGTDHRAFRVRPAQRGVHPIDLRSELLRPFEIFDDSTKHVVHSLDGVFNSGSATPTPSHTTSTRHSPMKWPASDAVRASVERDLDLRIPVRESTPIYEDRSLSPSPTSQTEVPSDTTPDTVMADAFAMTCHQTSRDMSAAPGSPRSRIMLPPPSPNRSITSSPTIRTFGGASPSTLRSPAIARVINLSQSPHRHTQYPSISRSVSPTGYHCSSLSSVSQPLLSPSPKLTFTPRAFLTGYDSESSGGVVIPTPPPIPESPAPIKQAKRGARRKSVSAKQGERVVKSRAVTGGVAIGKDDRSVTTSKTKKRAVTSGLIKGLAAQSDEGMSVNNAGRFDTRTNGPHEAMDIDIDLNTSMVRSNNSLMGTVVGTDNQSQPDVGLLRRSVRLRNKR